MSSIGGAWEAAGRKAQGADTLRVVLATGVLVYHSAVLNGADVAAVADLGSRVLVPAFMALSGFLLAASAERSDLRAFALNRALRIIPGLAVVVLLSALVMGPMLTTLPLDEYFSDRAFWRYLVSAVGWPSFTLPGVFSDLPGDSVNAPLWSIPIEILCYVSLAALTGAKVIRNHMLMLALWVVTLTVAAVPDMTQVTGPGLAYYLPRYLGQFPFFLTGGILYLFRHQVPRHIGILWGAIGLSEVAMMTGLYAALPILVGYATIYLATARLPRPAFLQGGDYSYGIYIYGSPIQQAVLYISPAVPWVNFALALPLTFACAVASWELVEKPALSLKKKKRAGPVPRIPAGEQVALKRNLDNPQRRVVGGEGLEPPTSSV